MKMPVCGSEKFFGEMRSGQGSRTRRSRKARRSNQQNPGAVLSLTTRPLTKRLEAEGCQSRNTSAAQNRTVWQSPDTSRMHRTDDADSCVSGQWVSCAQLLSPLPPITIRVPVTAMRRQNRLRSSRAHEREDQVHYQG